MALKSTNSPSADSPAYDFEAVNIGGGDYTPAVTCRALYVGTSGNVSVVSLGGTTTIFNNVLGGTILPIAFTKVTQANTTASNMVAMS
jgi:hypothetical protein